MASFKYLIFITSVMYAVSAEDTKTSEDVAKVKRHAYLAAGPGPLLSYSSAYPVHYAAEDDGQYWPGKYDKNELPAAYAAAPVHVAAAAAVPYYAAHPVLHAAEDDGQYWPGKYDKNELPAAYAAAPVYAPSAAVPYYAAHPVPHGAEDDGQYWPGKYDKNELPAAYAAAPVYAPSAAAPVYAPSVAVPYYAAHPVHHAAEDDGQYWPGKYEKTPVPAHPVAYHH